MSGVSGSGRYQNYAGVPVIGVYHWLNDQDLALLVEMHQEEAFAPARQLAGTIALTMAATTHQPDVILLDMMMPDMDGRVTLEQLKANSATRHIPVIMLTATVQLSDQESFSGLDVAAVFAKPFRPLKLVDQISATCKFSID